MTTTGARYANGIAEAVDELVAWTRATPADQLYRQPPDDEWTAMENLVHVVEFLPYWAAQVRHVVDHSGEPFGRTHTDPARAAWIEKHGADQVDEVVAALEAASAEVAAVLRSLPEAAWQATGVHANRGEMTLTEIVEFFLTVHLRDHVAQARRAVASAP